MKAQSPQSSFIEAFDFEWKQFYLAVTALISVINSIFLLSQVSTSTGVISHFVNLQVVVPEAFILGSGELHVDMGSAINLVCIIEKVGGSFVHFLFIFYESPS